MRDLDTRWIQRYSNFERAFLLLSDALQVENPSVLERAGLIQFLRGPLSYFGNYLRIMRIRESYQPLIAALYETFKAKLKRRTKKNELWIKRE